MPIIRSDAARLDRIAQARSVSPYRDTRQAKFMQRVVDRMEEKKRLLQIPERSINVMRYLADNPAACIVFDANVSQAWADARRAVSD